MKQFKIILLVLMIFAQLFITCKMVFDSEQVLKNGKTFKFRCAAVDPADPFKGRYVVLNFKDNEIEDFNYKFAQNNNYKDKQVFITFKENKEGFAKIEEIFFNKNNIKSNTFSKAKIIRLKNEKNQSNKKTFVVQFPFNKFFMQENKAPIAEKIYRNLSKTDMDNTYASVNIKNGNIVLKDVMVNGFSLVELAEQELVD